MISEIKIKQFSTSGIEVIEDKGSTICLYDKYLVESSQSDVIMNDELLDMPKQSKFDNVNIVLKKYIQGITLYFHNNKEVYGVEIFNSTAESINCYFQEREEAIEFQNKILDWLIN